jgi:hypothetical protein
MNGCVASGAELAQPGLVTFATKAHGFATRERGIEGGASAYSEVCNDRDTGGGVDTSRCKSESSANR